MRGRVNTYILLCAVGILTLASCTKEIIELPVPNDPVFILNGTLSGEEFHLVAGDNNAFMHTKSEMVNGVQLYSGELTDGNISVELGIFDGLVDKPGHVAVDELQNIVATFATRSPGPLVVLTKDLLGNSQNIESVDWYVNNSFAGSDEVEIHEPGKYDVCAYVTFTNQQLKVLCDEIIVGYERGASFSINDLSQPNQISANIVNAVGAQIIEVKWFLDEDLLPQQGQLISISADPELHRLRAEVHFGNGVVRTRTIVVDTENGVNHIDDFSSFELPNTYGVPNQDFNIRLKIKSNGKTYRSEYADNENSSLVITGIEYYGKNAKDKDVYKVSGAVDAVVMEMASEKMVSVTFSTVFGVEIE